MRIVNWNIERHAPQTWQAKSLLAEIERLEPDIVCLTEAWETSAELLGGCSISAPGAAWSAKVPGECKVLLWSKAPWRDVQIIDELEATGSAITAVTELAGVGIRFVGLCIPYHFASPLGQKPRAKPWRQHERFLEDLAPLLRGWREEGPVIVVGDYNRFIPRHWGPKRSYALLETALHGFDVVTAGDLPGVGKRAIDHIAVAGEFALSGVRGLPVEGPDGRNRSDHFGVVADLEFGRVVIRQA